MNALNLVIIGVAMLGVLPAVAWTWLNVRRATRRREHQFQRRASILVWAVVAVFLVGLRTAPEALALLVLAAHGVVLTLAVTLIEWRRAQMRERDWTPSYLFTRKA